MSFVLYSVFSLFLHTSPKYIYMLKIFPNIVNIPKGNTWFQGYVVPSAEAPQSSSTMALPLPSSGKPPNHEMVASGVPYSTTFFPTHFTGPPMFHTYHGAFVRPSFHFHNGEIQMYPYQPQPPFVPSSVVTYSSTILPPKIACYNCSSQSHHASECKEPTMEEYTSKGCITHIYGIFIILTDIYLFIL